MLRCININLTLKVARLVGLITLLSKTCSAYKCISNIEGGSVICNRKLYLFAWVLTLFSNIELYVSDSFISIITSCDTDISIVGISEAV